MRNSNWLLKNLGSWCHILSHHRLPLWMIAYCSLCNWACFCPSTTKLHSFNINVYYLIRQGDAFRLLSSTHWCPFIFVWCWNVEISNGCERLQLCFYIMWYNYVISCGSNQPTLSTSPLHCATTVYLIALLGCNVWILKKILVKSYNIIKHPNPAIYIYIYIYTHTHTHTHTHIYIF